MNKLIFTAMVTQMIARKVKKMIEKLIDHIAESEMYQQGLLAVVGTFVLAFLRTLSETGERSLMSQFFEALTCVILGMGFFFMCLGLGFHIYVAMASSLFVGHLGSIKVRVLAIRFFERK